MLREPVIYVAAPYADRNPDVITQRLGVVGRYAARMLAQGHLAFSPLTYTHGIQQLGYAPPAPKTWYSFDLQFLRQCDIIHVLTLPGWEQSRGVALEMEQAAKWGQPIRLVTLDAAGFAEPLLIPAGLPVDAGPLDLPCDDPPSFTYVLTDDPEPEQVAGRLIAAGVAAFCPRTYRSQICRQVTTLKADANCWQLLALQMRLRCRDEVNGDINAAQQLGEGSVQPSPARTAETS